MRIEQIYTGCLAQGAYYIESEGEAAIIDPLREVQPYIDRASANGARIKYVIETHFHADFVSGHLDLAKKTGATIIYGPTAKPGFEAQVLKDGEELKLGKITLRLLHTPGHTLESSCFLLIDENGKYHSVFTGDTLFMGDVGRPDLAQKRANMSKEELAGLLHDSIQAKLMPLPDDVLVYPGHGAGSACGKMIGKEPYDTLGHQKEVNYALQPMSREQFIKEVGEGQLPPPYYFPLNAEINKSGYPSLEQLIAKGTKALSPAELETIAESLGALVLDTRAPQTFKDGFIPRSINIWLRNDFAPWLGTLVTDIQQPIVLVCDEGTEEEAVTRMSRVGYDNCIGYLKGGIEAWKAAGREIDTLESIPAEEFASRSRQGELKVFDVRRQGEWDREHLEGAHFTSLQFINEHMAEFSKTEPNYIHCATGFRSMIAASILKARGYDNVIDIAGGFKAIRSTDARRVSGQLAQ